MSGRLLGAFRVIPVALWRHLGNELGIAAPEVASLRAMYERGRTLFDHQQVACTVLGFQWMSEHQRRSLEALEVHQQVQLLKENQMLLNADLRPLLWFRQPCLFQALIRQFPQRQQMLLTL